MPYHDIPIGSRSPRVINVVVEIPKGSSNKYEYDEKLDLIRLDRVLHSPIYYPFDYGFVPQTRSEDGDHLDALVLVTTPLFPGCVVTARTIGVIDMEDEAGQDWKVVAVADQDPRFKSVTSVESLGAHFKRETQHFFEEYKRLEHKWAGVRNWLGKEDAYRIIERSAERFLLEAR
jgi:inorganic pyrophosphatase